MIEEEVKESNDSVIEQLYVEIFKDKDTFVETMVENLKKVEEVETEMTGGVKRTLSEMDDCGLDEPEDLTLKILELLDKFEGESLVHSTKFFKLILKNGQPNLAIAHPRIQKKAGELSYAINLKGSSLKTDSAAFTNLDSEVMSGRGNTGPAFCTLVPIKDLEVTTRKRIFDKFNMEANEDTEDATEEPCASQDFPYTQSQTEETIMVCQVCRFATRDKSQLKDHMSTHRECDICYKFFASKDDLDHHMQDHMKVNCTECDKKVRRDEMLVHRMNHVKLKSFGRKVPTLKTIKPVTGYGMWQKEERTRIVQTNPEMTFNDVSSELGKRWKHVDDATKAIWKRQAMEFNEKLKANTTSTIEAPSEGTEAPSEHQGTSRALINLDAVDNLVVDDVLLDAADNLVVHDVLLDAVDDVLLEEQVEPSQPSIKKSKVIDKSNDCPLCDYESNCSREVAAHMKSKHKLMQTSILRCHKCALVFITENKLHDHMKSNHQENHMNISIDEDLQELMNISIDEDIQELMNVEELDELDMLSGAQDMENLVESPAGSAKKDVEVVLVKSKKLAWPAIIIGRENDVVEVKMIYDDKFKNVPERDIETFDVSKIGNTKNSRLKQAFAKAAELLKH